MAPVAPSRYRKAVGFEAAVLRRDRMRASDSSTRIGATLGHDASTGGAGRLSPAAIRFACGSCLPAWWPAAKLAAHPMRTKAPLSIPSVTVRVSWSSRRRACPPGWCPRSWRFGGTVPTANWPSAFPPDRPDARGRPRPRCDSGHPATPQHDSAPSNGPKDRMLTTWANA